MLATVKQINTWTSLSLMDSDSMMNLCFILRANIKPKEALCKYLTHYMPDTFYLFSATDNKSKCGCINLQDQ